WAVIDVGPIRGRDGRVTVAPTSASIARWSVFGVCCLFGVLVSRWVWVDRAHRRRIALSPEGILVPRTRWYWFSVEEFIPYADIRDCRIMVVKHLGAPAGVSRLQFRGPNGKVSVARDNLPDGAFDQICTLLRERVHGPRDDRLREEAQP